MGVIGRSLDKDDTLAARAGRTAGAGAAGASEGVSGRAEVGARALMMACSMAGRTL
jgi:hypothetical protein